MSDNLQRYLSVKQICDRVGVCRSLVYGWIAGGHLACYRLGDAGHRGTIRVNEADLDVFLADQRKEGRRKALPPVPKSPPLKLKHLQL